MMKTDRAWLIAVAILVVGWQGFAAVAAEPDVSLSLHASVDAIVAGKPFDVAVAFELPESSYLYWENPGDGGSPPRVAWKLPDGFAASPLRFPAPTRRVAAGGKAANVLDRNPVLMATMMPPAGLRPGERITIQAEVSWVVHLEKDYPATRPLEITLPVAAKAKPAAAEETIAVLAAAARAMPLGEGKAKYVTINPNMSKSTVAAGDQFEVLLDVKIMPGHHTQSNKPFAEFFIPTVVFVKPAAGLAFAEPSWSKPHVHTDKTLGKMSEFRGSFKVRIPVTVTGATPAENVRIAGLLTSQTCEDKTGRCYPPETVQWSVMVKSTSVAVSDVLPDAPAAAIATPTEPVGESDRANAVTPEPQQGGLTGLLGRLGLLGHIIGGFLGGLILNIMPCVLPVISIKVLGFVQQADEHPKRVFHLGLVFAAGIVVSFWVLAAGILSLQYFTDTVRGWGSFFQVPGFVIAMIVVMFVFALSLFGVFEVVLPGSASSRLAGASDKEGFLGAFLKGVLATLLATPCTAPFLAPAIAAALAAKGTTVVLIFTSAGVGMASPYILLTARPAWMKHLPKPGNWMIAFKQLMGFLLVGTVIWLLWVLAALLGASGIVWMVGFLAFLTLSAWLYGKVQFSPSPGRRAIGYPAVLGIALLGGWYSYGKYTPQATGNAASSDYIAQLVAAIDWTNALDWSKEKVPWVPYCKTLPALLSEAGHTVYLDYTAKWCLTCQANKKLVFSSDDVRKKMAAMGVIPIKADFTRYDPDIAEDLERFGRSAVPLNIILPAGQPDKPIELPVALLPGFVLEKLDQASPRSGRRNKAQGEAQRSPGEPGPTRPSP